MGSTFRIGKIKGIDIEVNISWFIIFILIMYSLATGYLPETYPDLASVFNWIVGAAIGVMFFFSVLLHELAHSLISQKLGISVTRISLYIFGGAAQIEKNPDEPLKEIKIAIAGPAMSILLAFVFLAISEIFIRIPDLSMISIPFRYMFSTNLLLAVFNLIPAFPLDGGRILRAILWKWKGDLKKSTKIASQIGKGFGYLLILAGFFLIMNGFLFNGIWFAFIGWLLIQMSQSEYRSLVTDVFEKIKVSEFMTKSVVTVDYNLPVPELIDEYFLKYKYSVFPVMRDGELIGVVRAETIKNLEKEFRNTKTAGTIRTSLSLEMTVKPGDSVSEAMRKISVNGMGRVLVISDEKQLLGIISNTDIVNYLRIYSKVSE